MVPVILICLPDTSELKNQVSVLFQVFYSNKSGRLSLTRNKFIQNGSYDQTHTKLPLIYPNIFETLPAQFTMLY